MNNKQLEEKIKGILNGEDLDIESTIKIIETQIKKEQV